MSEYVGDYAAGATVQHKWTTKDVDKAPIAPSSAFDSSDIRIYKGNSATQRTSTNGISVTSPFDSLVGVHHIAIDLSDNTDSGFYAAGNDYQVVLVTAKTVDGYSADNTVLLEFSIGNRDKTGYRLSATGVDDIWDEVQSGHAVSGSFGLYLDAAVSTRLPTSSYTTPPTVGAIADQVWDEATSGHTTSGTFGEQCKTDIDAILADSNELQVDWTNGGRLDLLLDATLADTNELQTDWANGGRLDLLLDATLADTNELQTDWTNGGRLDLIVDAILDDTGTAGVVVNTFTTAGKAEIQVEANDALVANNLDHLVLIAVDADFATTVHVNSVVGQIAQTSDGGFSRADDSLEAIRDRGDAAWVTGSAGPSAATIADAVWDEATSGHTTSGTFGEQVKTDIDSILDDTDLIDDGTSGLAKIATDVAAILVDTGTTLDAFIQAIKAKTDNLPSDPADASVIAAAHAAIEAKIDIVDSVADAILDDTGTAGVVVNSHTTAAKAELQQEATDALNAYDPPTNTEMEARTLVAASYATAAALTTLSTTVGAAGAGLTEAGGTGDHLTAVPWNAAWDAEVQSECADALTAFSVSTLTAAQVWASATRSLTDKSDFALTTAYDVYHADIKLNVDESNTQDEYTITWFKNGVRVTSGITVPTIQVVKRADGTDLIASTTPTQIASTGSYKHDATTTARMTAGQDALVIVGATIDGSARTFATLVGRDSSA